ncbi:MAG: putative extracellular nuclease, partial [Enterobacterales bacterium]
MKQSFMYHKATPNTKESIHKNLTRKSNKLILTLLSLAFLNPLQAAATFINEIHYDNSGSDTGEAIEIAGPSGTDLSGWSLILYNGNGGSSYDTVDLAGVIPNQQDSFGTLSFAISGIQNGAPDGLALIDAGNNVVQFLSYEGEITAANGPAQGATSVDIGVSEPGSTTVGFSLQLIGTGSLSEDFSWQEAAQNTFGDVNTNQVFGAGGPSVDTAPTIISSTPGDNTGVIALDSNISISFSESVTANGNWFQINCSKSGSHDATVDTGPQHYQLDPLTDFQYDEICEVSVTASLISDVDANDPPDLMESDVQFSFGTQVNTTIVINEVDADTPGSDTLEFIELYDGGVGNTSLDGLVVVLYNGSDDKSYNHAFDLDGFTTDSDGFFLLGNDAVVPKPSIIIDNNGLQNGADAVAIHAGNAVDYSNDTPVSGYSLVDAVVYDTSDSDDQGLLNILTPGQVQNNERGNGDGSAHSNARVPDGGAALDTSSYTQQDTTPGVSNVPSAEIFVIQGNGNTSSFEDQFVKSFNNVVTAIDTNGFFMQTPSVRSDNDIETSDGIFVFTGSAPTVSVGDHIDVVGEVVEFFNFTEFSNNPIVTVNSSGNPLPEAVIFDESMPSKVQPQSSNELERFEGMIIAFDGTASAATNRFGNAAVVASNVRAFREPGLIYPGINDLPVWDGNPEIFELDANAMGLENVDIFAGQSLSAIGPLGFSFGSYQIWPTTLTLGPMPDLLSKVRDRAASEMTVGSLNMFRPSQRASVYQARLTKISEFVRTVMDSPDILAVSEVEDITVLQTIADQINADDASVNYTPYLIEGNDIGGIDVGFLTRSSIELDEVIQFGKDEILDFDDSLLNDRPPLLFKGHSVENGHRFPIQVIVVHNRSLSRIDSSSSGNRVRLKRLAQAQFVANIVQEIQSENPMVNLVVTGDFNAYQFSDGYVDVVGQITGLSNEADNLVWELSPVSPMLTNQVDNIAPEEQYSFVFSGSAQVL